MRPADVEVREAREDDLFPLLELYAHLHGDPVPKGSPALDALWRGIMADPNHHIIVADGGGRLLSSCVVVVIPNLTRGQRPYALIENVVTHREFRRQGLAEACIGYAKELAVRAGCYKIMLMTGAKDEGTLAFYEKCGFNRQDKTAFIKAIPRISGGADAPSDISSNAAN